MMHAKSRCLVSLAANETVSVCPLKDCQLYDGLKALISLAGTIPAHNWQEDASLWGKKLKHVFY